MVKSTSTKESAAADLPVGTVVLGKIRGFPAWPSIICDPTTAPKAVALERPKNGASLVKFFPKADFSWLTAKDMQKLTPAAIDSFLGESGKRNAELITAYRIAQNPKKWEEERENMQGAAASADEDVDELDSEGDGAKKSRKRKRASEAASVGKKGRAGSTASAKKSTTSKGKKNGVKSKAAVESEDDGADAEGDVDAGTSISAPMNKKAKKDEAAEAEAAAAKDPEAVRVRDWRHKLQKTFLSTGKGPIKTEDMPGMDTLFTTIEEYDKMNIAYLSFSKIGKVMRHIAALQDDLMPQSTDDEFHFRERARKLVDRWHLILHTRDNGANPSNGNPPAAPEEKKDGSVTMADTTPPPPAAIIEAPVDVSMAEVTA